MEPEPLCAPASGPRNLDPAREQAILDAALKLLTDVGYDRMSIDEIARQARASKATIYRRWSGKAPLVAALLHRLGPERTTLPDTGSLRGDLMAGLALFCRVAERKHALLLGLMPAVRADAELARLLRDHIAEPGAAKATALFERARARGEIGSVPDPGPLLEVAQALVWRRLLVTGDPLDDGFVAHAVDRMLLPIVHGDAARPPA